MYTNISLKKKLNYNNLAKVTNITRLYNFATRLGKYMTRVMRQHRHIIKQGNNTINQENHKYSSACAWLSGDDALATVRLPQRSLYSQSLGKY